jgi:prepilin-type N-terminal cleavage/methylation domain-containing protein
MSVCRITGWSKDRFAAQGGVTLVELLIAAVAFGIVSMGALSFYRSQHSQYMQQTEVSDMQQNLRVVMVELATQIRQAGYNTKGVVPVQVMGGHEDMLLVRYHDGESVRARIFFLLPDSLGRSNMMTQLNGEAPQLFAEGIDSLHFNAGGSGGAVNWVTVNLVARTEGDAFQTAGTPTGERHLYRRLNSTIKLRNG